MKTREEDNDLVMRIMTRLITDMASVKAFTPEKFIEELRVEGVTNEEDITHYLDGAAWFIRGMQSSLLNRLRVGV